MPQTLRPSLRRAALGGAALLGATLLAGAFLATFHGSALAQGRMRIIVLTFEGWHAAQTRDAVVEALSNSYELIEEQTAISAASDIGVDVSTPEGMQAVVAHLGIELVVGGFVEGRARTATTTVWVSDIQGNELTRRSAGAPTGRDWQAGIAAAARGACSDAILALRPPTPAPVLVEEPAPMPLDDEPPPREEEPEDPNRWRQPIFRGLVGLDLRNRTASLTPNPSVDRFDAGFFPVIAVALEARPLAASRGAESGLYASLSTGFSAGMSYTSVSGEELPMNAYHLDGAVGYAGTLANAVELGGTVGLGLDGFGLERPASGYLVGDYRSTELFYVRPGLFARVRLFENAAVLEGGVGGRIFVGTGEIGSFDGATDFGYGGGGGVDFNLGLAGILGPGFAYAARFGYTGGFLSFSEGTRQSATDEAFHIQLMVGYAYVP